MAMSPLAAWLAAALELCSLEEEHRDYVMGRGATPEVIERWQIRTFDPPPQACPDPRLHKHYGECFDRFEGKIVYPLFSPRGRLLGFDSRTAYQKDDDRYLLPESRWNPVWIGMPSAMDAVWAGADIVVVEGRADVWAMLHACSRGQAVLGSGPAHLAYRHVDFLERWARGDVYMAYDNDDAGKKGIADAIENLDRRGVACSRVRYGRAGDDPGKLWDRGGVEALREAFPHF